MEEKRKSLDEELQDIRAMAEEIMPIDDIYESGNQNKTTYSILVSVKGTVYGQ